MAKMSKAEKRKLDKTYNALTSEETELGKQYRILPTHKTKLINVSDDKNKPFYMTVKEICFASGLFSENTLEARPYKFKEKYMSGVRGKELIMQKNENWHDHFADLMFEMKDGMMQSVRLVLPNEAELDFDGMIAFSGQDPAILYARYAQLEHPTTNEDLMTIIRPLDVRSTLNISDWSRQFADGSEMTLFDYAIKNGVTIQQAWDALDFTLSGSSGNKAKNAVSAGMTENQYKRHLEHDEDRIAAREDAKAEREHADFLRSMGIHKELDKKTRKSSKFNEVSTKSNNHDSVLYGSALQSVDLHDNVSKKKIVGVASLGGETMIWRRTKEHKTDELQKQENLAEQKKRQILVDEKRKRDRAIRNELSKIKEEDNSYNRLYRFLNTFVENPSEVISRFMLVDYVEGDTFDFARFNKETFAVLDKRLEFEDDGDYATYQKLLNELSADKFYDEVDFDKRDDLVTFVNFALLADMMRGSKFVNTQSIVNIDINDYERINFNFETIESAYEKEFSGLNVK